MYYINYFSLKYFDSIPSFYFLPTSSDGMDDKSAVSFFSPSRVLPSDSSSVKNPLYS